MHYNYMVAKVQHIDPTCFQEVVQSKYWNEAMEEEMETLEKNHKRMGVVANGREECISKWFFTRRILYATNRRL